MSNVINVNFNKDVNINISDEFMDDIMNRLKLEQSTDKRREEEFYPQIANIFDDYKLQEFYITETDIVSNKIENSFLPLGDIRYFKLDKENDILTIYDRDQDEYSHKINLKTEEYIAINMKQLDKINTAIEELIKSQPCNTEFKVEDDCLVARQDGCEFFIGLGELDNITNIKINEGIIEFTFFIRNPENGDNKLYMEDGMLY